MRVPRPREAPPFAPGQGQSSLGARVPFSALTRDPNQVLPSTWTMRDSWTQWGRLWDPQLVPSPGPTATRAPGQPHTGASKGGRVPQRARPVFGGLIRAGEALSYAMGLFHTQGGNPKRRHTEAKGGEFWQSLEKPHQAPPPWAQSESPGTALAWGLDALTSPVHPSTSGISGTRHPYPLLGGRQPPQLPPQASGQAGHPISPEPTTGPQEHRGFSRSPPGQAHTSDAPMD